MANSIWNTADKSANMTLSAGNLVATATGSSAWVRTVDSQTAGKFYWEVAATAFTNVNTAIGIATKTANLLNGMSGGAVVGTCSANRSGLIYADGSFTGLSAGTIAGNVVCVACDLTAKLIWFRNTAAGQWNGSGTANPATGVGGVSIPNIGGVASCPAFWATATTEAATANFGDTTFSGAVPAGYTVGWPGAASAVGQARVMVLA